jgi:hypothetical protein
MVVIDLQNAVTVGVSSQQSAVNSQQSAVNSQQLAVIFFPYATISYSGMSYLYKPDPIDKETFYHRLSKLPGDLQPFLAKQDRSYQGDNQRFPLAGKDCQCEDLSCFPERHNLF